MIVHLAELLVGIGKVDTYFLSKKKNRNGRNGSLLSDFHNMETTKLIEISVKPDFFIEIF